MCGRYSLTSNAEALVSQFRVQTMCRLTPRYNISPSQNCPVITQSDDNLREIRSMRWGLVPHWSKNLEKKLLLFNARSETINTKPSFKHSFRRRHCLVPADGYYEWITKGSCKTPYRITIKTAPTFAFAGLWDVWQDHANAIYSFTILTTQACPQLQSIHHRMPVIIEPHHYSSWLENREDGLSQKNHFAFTTTKLGSRVNNPKNDDPELLRPQS